MKKFIPFLFLVFTLGCEHTPVENYKNVLNVSSMLRPDDRWPPIIINRTYKMNEESSEEDIKDALVILTSNHSTDTFELIDTMGMQSIHYQSWHPISVKPGDTFHLYIKAPDFDSVYGTTIVPDSITIIHPSEGDSVKQSDSLVIKSDKGKYYKFTIYNEDSLLWEQELVSYKTDSLIIIQFSWFVLDLGNYKIKIEVYDKNYTEYYSEHKPSGGISGGFGVFGSTVTKTISLYLKE